ncbi:MAG: hypothetical protein KJO40_19525 [Deltaproteobacteria bacterium]|nr:hypothetical protein [Deltaproteobacteria bacterium]
MNADAIEKALRAGLRAAMREAKDNPEFLQRIARAVCEELGADPLIGMYLVTKATQGLRHE